MSEIPPCFVVAMCWIGLALLICVAGMIGHRILAWRRRRRIKQTCPYQKDRK